MTTKLCTIPELARATGYCAKFLRRCLALGMRHVRVGGMIFVRAEWLDEFLVSRETTVYEPFHKARAKAEELAEGEGGGR